MSELDPFLRQFEESFGVGGSTLVSRNRACVFSNSSTAAAHGGACSMITRNTHRTHIDIKAIDLHFLTVRKNNLKKQENQIEKIEKK